MTSIPYLLAYAHTLAGRAADAALRPHELTLRQYGLLAQLDLEPELTMAELARQLGVSRQALYELVGELESRGHLRRAPGATGRTRRLVLTPRATRLLVAVRAPLRRAEADFLRGLRPEEAAALRHLLQKLLAHATDDEAWLTPS
ncbi:MarR family transcriptional regulator [Actinomycetes bacterium KLBMP 9797]